MLGVAQPFIIGFSNQQCFGSGSVCCFSCGKDLDPDPACPLDADPDPDPAFHSDADLDPDPAFYFDAGQLRLRHWLSVALTTRLGHIDPGSNPIFSKWCRSGSLRLLISVKPGSKKERLISPLTAVN
jgi:hypothetical protein